MTALDSMITSVHEWLSENSLGVAGYSFCSSLFAQIPLQVGHLGSIILTMGHINVLLAFLIGIITLTVKGVEAWEKFKKLLNRKPKDETKPDSDRVG